MITVKCTVAYQAETEKAKHNIQVGEVLLQDTRKHPQFESDEQSVSPEDVLMPNAP